MDADQQGKLAIVLPHTGQPTETFIKRYFDELCPERTVLVSFYRGADSWRFHGPSFCLEEQFFKNRNLYKAFRGLQKIAGINSLFGDPLTGLMLKRFLLKQNVQVVFSQYLVAAWNVHRVVKSMGLRHVIRGHGFDLSSSLDDPVWCKRYQDLEYADGIFVPTPYQTNRLRNIGLKRVPIIEQPCGVDLPQNLTSRSEGAARYTRLLATGRMVAKKAPMVLLKSFHTALFQVPSLKLTWIGAGPLEEEVRAYISQHGLEDQIKLLGSVPHSDVLKELQKADIFIQHSMTDPQTGDQEGAPVAILEAMAHGLPVISTIHSGIPYLVEDQVTGLLSNEEDFEGMAGSIVQLANDASLRAKMGYEGKVRSHSFSWENEKKGILNQLNLS
jgi:glycosyltransferase involved in cell wall biosynthesis